MRDFRPVSKWRKMTSTITMVALCAIIGLAMMVIIVEWLVGCGEKEYSSDGTYDVILFTLTDEAYWGPTLNELQFFITGAN